MERLLVSTMCFILAIILVPPFLLFTAIGVIIKKTWFYLMSKVEIDE